MTIWFDIAHIPQYNFYKWLIKRLASDGHSVVVSVLRRGKLYNIVSHEIGEIDGIEIVPVGRHRSNKWSAIFEANLIRIFQLITWSRKYTFDLGFSNGYQLALIGALTGMPSFSFDDDPETIDYWPKLWWNTETNYCIYKYNKRLDAKAKVLPVLKEWSYLSPDYFKPNEKCLETYGINAKEYIFIREVSVGTINYSEQNYGAVADIVEFIPKNKTVLLSLERKETRNLYPKEWILLKEPVEDIHSLIYFSSALISSGDSMAREAALLGVPSYYLGIRIHMPANEATMNISSLNNSESMDFKAWIKSIDIPAEEQIKRQLLRRRNLLSQLLDINAYMLKIVKRANATQ